MQQSLENLLTEGAEKYRRTGVATHHGIRFTHYDLSDVVDEDEKYIDFLGAIRSRDYMMNEIVRTGTLARFFLDIDTPLPECDLCALCADIIRIMEEDFFAPLGCDDTRWAKILVLRSPEQKTHLIFPDLALTWKGEKFQRLLDCFAKSPELSKVLDLNCTARGSLRMPGQSKCSDPTRGKYEEAALYDTEWRPIPDPTSVRQRALFSILSASRAAVALRDSSAAPRLVSATLGDGSVDRSGLREHLGAVVRHASQPFALGYKAALPFDVRVFEAKISEELKWAFGLNQIVQTVVCALNRDFAYIGMVDRVLYRQQHPWLNDTVVPAYMKVPAFLRTFNFLSLTLQEKETSMARVWMDHPLRRTYIDVTFQPDPAVSVPPLILNTYAGLRWPPSELRVAKQNASYDASLRAQAMQDHVLKIICAEDEAKFKWLMLALAAKARRPWLKIKVMAILKGHEGNGKGLFVSTYGRLFGSHFLNCYRLEQALTRFNGSFEDVLVAFIDEGYWAGHKQAVGPLKALVTEDVMHLERKHIDEKTTRNYIFLIGATNDDWVAPVGTGARRYAIFDTAELRPQVDPHVYHDYFATLVEFSRDEEAVKCWLGQFFDEQVYSDAALDAFGSGMKLPASFLRSVSDQRHFSADSTTLFWQECLRRGYHLDPSRDWFLRGYETDIRLKVMNENFGSDGRSPDHVDKDNEGNVSWTEPWLAWAAKEQIYQEYRRTMGGAVLARGRFDTVTSTSFWQKTAQLFPWLAKDRRTRLRVVRPLQSGASSEVPESAGSTPCTVKLRVEIVGMRALAKCRDSFRRRSGFFLGTGAQGSYMPDFVTPSHIFLVPSPGAVFDHEVLSSSSSESEDEQMLDAFYSADSDELDEFMGGI